MYIKQAQYFDASKKDFDSVIYILNQVILMMHALILKSLVSAPKTLILISIDRETVCMYLFIRL